MIDYWPTRKVWQYWTLLGVVSGDKSKLEAENRQCTVKSDVHGEIPHKLQHRAGGLREAATSVPTPRASMGVKIQGRAGEIQG